MRLSEEWESVPTDPDPETHLGYEQGELNVIRSLSRPHLVLLPEDEAHVADEEFIISTESSLRDVTR